MSRNRRGKKSLFIMLFLALTMITGFRIDSVLADVPTVESIEPWTSETDTILNITIRHSSPTTSHYVDKIDIDGAVNNVPLTPQSTATFVVQYNMGEVVNTPIIQARAHCTFHGWSGWSESVEIPEFSTAYLLLVLAIVTITVVLLRSKISSSKRDTRALSDDHSA
jgi:hypothetical protein